MGSCMTNTDRVNDDNASECTNNSMNNELCKNAETLTDKHHKKHEWLADIELVEWMKNNDTNFIVIDVRQSNMDYLGGHIKGAINIQHTSFIKQIKQLIENHYKVKNIIFHCMYSQSRGPLCANWYCMALEGLLTEFHLNDNDNIQSYEQSVYLNKCLNENTDFSVLLEIEIDQNKYKYLCNQNIYVLRHGFVNFVNKYRNDKSLVSDFDNSFWITQRNSNVLLHKNDW
eukprot:262183_1